MPPNLMTVTPETITSAIAGLVGGGTLTALVAAYVSLRKDKLDGAKTVAEAKRIEAETQKILNDADPEAAAVRMLTELINMLNTQLHQERERGERQQARVDAMDAEITTLRVEVSNLRVENSRMKEKTADLQAAVTRHEERISQPDPFAAKFSTIGGWNTMSDKK